MNSSWASHHLALAVASAALLAAPSAHAQGSTFTGRVLTDSGVALAGAEVVLNGPNRSARTDANGEFRLSHIPAGEHIVQVRMPGFAPKVDTIEVADAGEVRLDFRLAKIETTLPEVSVSTSSLDRKLVEFHERRRIGIGRFLDSTEFANAHGTRTSDRLTKLPGLKIGRGRFLSEAYVLSTRSPSKLAMSGGRECRAAIWLDGVKLNDFSVNQLDPSMIAAVEWYAGPASVPAKFNVTSSVCGVLVIWTR
jgi:hypothetical protein